MAPHRTALLSLLFLFYFPSEGTHSTGWTNDYSTTATQQMSISLRLLPTATLTVSARSTETLVVDNSQATLSTIGQSIKTEFTRTAMSTTAVSRLTSALEGSSTALHSGARFTSPLPSGLSPSSVTAVFTQKASTYSIDSLIATVSATPSVGVLSTVKSSFSPSVGPLVSRKESASASATIAPTSTSISFYSTSAILNKSSLAETTFSETPSLLGTKGPSRITSTVAVTLESSSVSILNTAKLPSTSLSVGTVTASTNMISTALLSTPTSIPSVPSLVTTTTSIATSAHSSVSTVAPATTIPASRQTTGSPSSLYVLSKTSSVFISLSVQTQSPTTSFITTASTGKLPSSTINVESSSAYYTTPIYTEATSGGATGIYSMSFTEKTASISVASTASPSMSSATVSPRISQTASSTVASFTATLLSTISLTSMIQTASVSALSSMSATSPVSRLFTASTGKIPSSSINVKSSSVSYMTPMNAGATLSGGTGTYTTSFTEKTDTISVASTALPSVSNAAASTRISMTASSSTAASLSTTTSLTGTIQRPLASTLSSTATTSSPVSRLFTTTLQTGFASVVASSAQASLSVEPKFSTTSEVASSSQLFSITQASPSITRMLHSVSTKTALSITQASASLSGTAEIPTTQTFATSVTSMSASSPPSMTKSIRTSLNPSQTSLVVTGHTLTGTVSPEVTSHITSVGVQTVTTTVLTSTPSSGLSTGSVITETISPSSVVVIGTSLLKTTAAPPTTEGSKSTQPLATRTALTSRISTVNAFTGTSIGYESIGISTVATIRATATSLVPTLTITSAIPPTTKGPSKSRSLVGVWIGVATGAFLLLILIVIIVIVCKRKRSRRYSVALYDDDQARDHSMQRALEGNSKGVEWEMMESRSKTFTDTSDSTFEETDGEETAGLLKNRTH